jgi:DNA-binding response OmpR family regulator
MVTKKTILVIEDEMMSRYTLNVLLKSKDFNLIFAENGKQGLEKLEDLTPDLVLLDLIMPGMNGFEVCKSLRANSRFKKLPVVMMTAWDDEETYLRCLKHGATDVLSKPFNYADLNTMVNHYLYKSQQKK